jgi:hypothetical protein
MPRRGGLGHLGHEAISRAVEADRERHAPVIGERPRRANPAVITHEEPGEAEAEAELSWRPLRTSWPDNSTSSGPRCSEGSYNPDTGELFVRFYKPTPGQDEYVYEGVSKTEAYNFLRSVSPGRYINRVLNAKDYHRVN